MIATITQFIAPVFFPTDNMPAVYQFLVSLNPITLPIIELRNLLFWGGAINWLAWGGNVLMGFIIFCFGLCFFDKMRSGFADVL
jgi:lipopolysaccharide transport system permease protein